jgi:hypothetical protein
MINKIDPVPSYASKLFNTAKEARTQSKIPHGFSLNNQKNQAFEAVTKKITGLKNLHNQGCSSVQIEILSNQLAFLFMVANMMLRQGSNFHSDDGFELLVKQFLLNYNQLNKIDEQVSEKEILEFSKQIIVLNTHQHKGQFIKSAGRALFSPGALAYTNKTAYFSGADDYTSFTKRAGQLLDELVKLDNDLGQSSKKKASICLSPTIKLINRSLYKLMHTSQVSKESIKFALLNFSNKLYAGKVEAEIIPDLEENVATLITAYEYAAKVEAEITSELAENVATLITADDKEVLPPYQHSFGLLPLEKFLALIISAVKNRANLNGILANKEEIFKQFMRLSSIEADATCSSLILDFFRNLYSALNIKVDASSFNITDEKEIAEFKNLRKNSLSKFGKFAESWFETIRDSSSLFETLEDNLAKANGITENQHEEVDQILYRVINKLCYRLFKDTPAVELISQLIKVRFDEEKFKAKLHEILENNNLDEFKQQLNEIKSKPFLKHVTSDVQDKIIKFMGFSTNNEAVIDKLEFIWPIKLALANQDINKLLEIQELAAKKGIMLQLKEWAIFLDEIRLPYSLKEDEIIRLDAISSSNTNILPESLQIYIRKKLSQVKGISTTQRQAYLHDHEELLRRFDGLDDDEKLQNQEFTAADAIFVRSNKMFEYICRTPLEKLAKLQTEVSRDISVISGDKFGRVMVEGLLPGSYVFEVNYPRGNKYDQAQIKIAPEEQKVFSLIFPLINQAFFADLITSHGDTEKLINKIDELPCFKGFSEISKVYCASMPSTLLNRADCKELFVDTTSDTYKYKIKLSINSEVLEEAKKVLIENDVRASIANKHGNKEKKFADFKLGDPEFDALLKALDIRAGEVVLEGEFIDYEVPVSHLKLLPNFKAGELEARLFTLKVDINQYVHTELKSSSKLGTNIGLVPVLV